MYYCPNTSKNRSNTRTQVPCKIYETLNQLGHEIIDCKKHFYPYPYMNYDDMDLSFMFKKNKKQ